MEKLVQPIAQQNKKQQGAVLIIVLLIVALITGLVLRFNGNFQLTMARAEQRLHGGQANHYLLSVESFAQWGLTADAQADKENGNGSYDHLGEKWAATKISAPVDGGWTEAELTDAQGRFNINQLQGRPQPYQPNGAFGNRFTPAQRRFIRLLQTDENNPVSSSDAIPIMEAIIDWIDADDNTTGAGGAESAFYAGQTVPYRAANQLFVSITELRLVRGITPDIYRYLEPLVIALPDNSGINLNTAPAVIMRTINTKHNPEPLSKDDVHSLMNDRPTEDTAQTDDSSLDVFTNNDNDQEGFKATDDFLNSAGFQAVFGADPTIWPEMDGLTTGSNYFLLTAEAQVVNQYRRGVSLLKRVQKDNAFKTLVIRRSQNQL